MSGHGIPMSYVRGCRCDGCCEAWANRRRLTTAQLSARLAASAIGSEAAVPPVAASDRVAEPRAKSAIEQDAPPP